MRLFIVGLILITAGALGLIAWQIANPAHPVAIAAIAAAPAPRAATKYLVAARALPPGTLTRESDISAKAATSDELPQDAIIDDEPGRASLTGALVQRYVDAGTPITIADLLRPRERGFLAAVLAPGTRAVSIGVDPITGVSGLIWPGDRVDIISTQEMERTPNAAAKRITGETVLTNIRVIAIDQDIVQGTTPGTSVAGKLASTVTLQASTDEAERLAVASRMGHLSLAIRASGGSVAASASSADKFPTISGDDVSPALSAANGVGRSRVQVIQGDQRSEVTFR